MLEERDERDRKTEGPLFGSGGYFLRPVVGVWRAALFSLSRGHAVFSLGNDLWPNPPSPWKQRASSSLLRKADLLLSQTKKKKNDRQKKHQISRKTG